MATQEYRTIGYDYISSIREMERLYLHNQQMCLRSNHTDTMACAGSGQSIGLFIDGKLVAYTLVNVNEYNVAFVEKCFVLSVHRGNGYQKEMLSMVLSNLQACGVKDCYTMVSEDNIASVKSFESVGFTPHNEVKIGVFDRIIMKMQL